MCGDRSPAQNKQQYEVDAVNRGIVEKTNEP